jgi:hypothetical protein
MSAPDAADAERLIQSDSAAAEELAQFQEIAQLIALAAPSHRPPVALRERVLAAAKRSPSLNRRRWRVPIGRFLPAASLAAVLAIVSVWAVNLQHDLDALRDESALLTAVVEADARRIEQLAAQPSSDREIGILETQLQQTQSATSILVDPEAQSAELVATEAAHGATGAYTWSASADAAVVVLRNLQPIGFSDVIRITLLDRWGNVVATQSALPSETGETMVLIQTPQGAWPQSVVVFATNQASNSSLPDGPVILEVTSER